jgi:Glycosyltransferases, probably involved in cell wall biogenesis
MEDYSVLMSVYCKENPQYFLQSIQSLVDQTVPSNDIVIVCDGPLNPELDAVLIRFTALYDSLFQIVRLKENHGLGYALNVGMRYCKNELVARMDSDDVAVAERCEKQLFIFERYNVDIVSGTVAEFTYDIQNIVSERVLPKTQEAIIQFAKRRCPFNHPCVMYKKSVVQAAGGYQHFYLFEDYYLWIRMLKSGSSAYNIKEPILFMRAGKEMYKRRGGRSYIKSMLKLRWYMKSIGFCNWGDFLISVIGQTVICLIPNQFREKIYNRFLRN